MNHKLLPVTNIDIVLNFSNNLVYQGGVGETKVPQYSFTSIKNKYLITNQKNRLNSFGISFYPAGLYSFLKRSLVDFSDQTIDLALVTPEFCTSLEYSIDPGGKSLTQIDHLEKILINFIDPQLILNQKMRGIFAAFSGSAYHLNINEFCQTYGVNPRTLQRWFRKYCGITPKVFKKINRFQKAVRSLITIRPAELTSIAYQHGYYDQAHFNNEFKKFSGSSPSIFLKEKKSLKQNLIIK